eukprot:1493452-Rhodomonas_salina.2
MAANAPFEIRRRWPGHLWHVCPLNECPARAVKVSVLRLATLISARSDGTLHAQQRKSQQASTAAEKRTWLADTADDTVRDPVGFALSALQASA